MAKARVPELGLSSLFAGEPPALGNAERAGRAMLPGDVVPEVRPSTGLREYRGVGGKVTAKKLLKMHPEEAIQAIEQLTPQEAEKVTARLARMARPVEQAIEKRTAQKAAQALTGGVDLDEMGELLGRTSASKVDDVGMLIGDAAAGAEVARGRLSKGAKAAFAGRAAAGVEIGEEVLPLVDDVVEAGAKVGGKLGFLKGAGKLAGRVAGPLAVAMTAWMLYDYMKKKLVDEPREQRAGYAVREMEQRGRIRQDVEGLKQEAFLKSIVSGDKFAQTQGRVQSQNEAAQMDELSRMLQEEQKGLAEASVRSRPSMAEIYAGMRGR